MWSVCALKTDRDILLIKPNFELIEDDFNDNTPNLCL